MRAMAFEPRFATKLRSEQLRAAFDAAERPQQGCHGACEVKSDDLSDGKELKHIEKATKTLPKRSQTP